MCKEGQSLLIDREREMSARCYVSSTLADIFLFWGDGNSGNPGRVPGIVRLEEIRGVVPGDEETRDSGR